MLGSERSSFTLTDSSRPGSGRHLARPGQRREAAGRDGRERERMTYFGAIVPQIQNFTMEIF